MSRLMMSPHHNHGIHRIRYDRGLGDVSTGLQEKCCRALGRTLERVTLPNPIFSRGTAVNRRYIRIKK
jgi:hypothetical protein